MEFKDITFETKEGVTYIGFGKNEQKSMTTLTENALKELDRALDQLKTMAKNKESTGLILFSHKSNCYLAGADINLIASLKTQAEGADGAEQGQHIFNKIEDLPFPSVACVHGVCLGGGLEISLACSCIIASDDPRTQLGLPEVKLGLIPGFGGTYRLPKRVGLPDALDMILSGKQVRAAKAKKLGLVEEVYPKERLLDMALKHLQQRRESSRSFLESMENLASDSFIGRKIIFQKARESVLKKTKGFYQAPLKILDVMESGGTKGRTAYLSSEAQAFGELCISEQSKNLQHIFFMVDESKKKAVATKADIANFRGGVLGAGTMGGGIAWLFADNGQRPIMKDINKEGLELGLKQASKNFQEKLIRRRMSEDDFERKMRSITPTTQYNGFKKIDLVIEAIVENMDIKKKVFAEMEKEVSETCLITSNTSSLSINEMASALENNSRFAGLHFFNPVHRMPLVEIIRHKNVSDETIQTLYNWVVKVKKTPVVVNDGPGFLVNRILMPFIGESAYLLEEGVSIKDLDKAVLNFGMPMGPCRLMDEVGLDVLVHVGEIMHKGLGERAKPPELSEKLVKAGLLGKKNKKGFYLYDEKGKDTEINPKIGELLSDKNKKMDEVEIQMRVFLPMINEAANILQDKIVDSAADVDLGLIFGIGFPPFRGGLLRYADSEGPDRILKAIQRFEGSVSSHRYKPSDYLKSLVEQKKKFYDI